METEPQSPAKPRYRRIVIKLSGEALTNEESPNPINGDLLKDICQELKDVHDLGIEIGLVVGGGNIFRGLQGEKKEGVNRTTGDFMGMLGTAVNGLALMDCLEKIGVPVRVQSALTMNDVAEPFIYRRAIRHLEKGRLVIFVSGTGNPYFSSDTAAALRASEIEAEVFMKATKVDGIYDKDPITHADAVRYETISYMDALKQRLDILDSTAFSLCMDNNLPILVFNMNEPGNIKKAVTGERIGTLVH